MIPDPTSFSIFANPRPIRTAFIVDPETISEELIDAIFEFNIFHWGGRYNPILPSVGNSMADSYWKLLKFCDPDMVYSCVELDELMLQRIKRWVSPYQIEIHRAQPGLSHLLALYHDQIDIEQIARNYRFSPADFDRSFVLPVCSRRGEWRYSRFFQRNFGLIAEHSPISHLDRFSKLAIGDDSKPEDFLAEMRNARNLVLPVNFCKAFVDFPQTLQAHLNDRFTIVVGDSIWSWIYCWNTIFLLSNWQRTTLSQMCLPKELLDSDKALEATRKFLGSQLLWSSSQHPRIEVVSFDRSEEELKDISRKINQEIGAYWTVKRLEKNVFPEVERSHQDIESRPTTQHYQVFGNKVFIRSPEPDFLSSAESSFWSSGRRWMVDLKIEYRPERFFYTNAKYWWRLPKFRDVALCFSARGQSRITLEGFVSVSCEAKEKNLKVRIPSDGQVVLTALTSGSGGFDPYYYKERKPVGPYQDLRISDKGGYLRGFVTLFPSLWHASEFCKNRYWRNVLESMCRNTEQSDKRRDVRNRLNKDLPKWVDKFHEKPEETKELLERFIMAKAKDLGQVTADIEFESLLEQLAKEREEFKQQDEYRGFDSSEGRCRADLVESLSTLTSRGVFFQGIKPKCEVCGSRFWYNAEEIKRKLTCKGCNEIIHLPAEVPWTYRLNELLLNAIAYHGVIPVVWALGNLLHQSRDSFIYTPSVELVTDSEPPRPLGDLDLAFISDGEFVVGEVKKSSEEFGSGDLDKLADICKIMLPDRVILAAFQGPEAKLSARAQELNIKLANTGIKVAAIYPGKDVFEPSYHIYT